MGVREYYYTRKRSALINDSNAIFLLIAVNLALFIILGFIKVVFTISNESNEVIQIAYQQKILDWFILPSSFAKFITRPWTIVTFMFTHDGFFNLLGNMLWLWGFGYILQDLAGNKRIIPIYLYGGLTGGIVFLLSAGLLPHFHQPVQNIPGLLGATPSVITIVLATTVMAPDYRIFPFISRGIPLWALTVFFVIISYISIQGNSSSYLIAYLASGLMGMQIIWQLKNGNDWCEWMNNLVNWFNDLFHPERDHWKKLKEKRVRQYNKPDRQPYKKTQQFSQRRLDEILDKINKEGYHKLNEEEKDFLNKVSKEEL